MWGSAFATSLYEIFLKTGHSGLGFLGWHRSSVNVTGESRGLVQPPPLASRLPGPWKKGKGERWIKDGSISHCTTAFHPDDSPKFRLQDPTRLPTRLFIPQNPFSQAVLDIFTSRFTCTHNFNFTRGLCLYKDYVANTDFVAWKGEWYWGAGEQIVLKHFFLMCIGIYLHSHLCESIRS